MVFDTSLYRKFCKFNIVNDNKFVVGVQDNNDNVQIYGKNTIKKELTGSYFVMIVEADHETIKEFDRKAKIDENILRHIVIREEE